MQLWPQATHKKIQEFTMLSHDLENLARALEQMTTQFPAENATILHLVCSNLQALADRAEALEHMPLAVQPCE